MRKKILLCITKAMAGGAQKYVYDLATHLPPDQFDVAVVAGSPREADKAGGKGPLFDMLQQRDIRTIPVATLKRDINPVHELQAFANLTRIFIREKPDIIHLNSSKMGSMGALAAWMSKLLTLNFKPRVVFTVHGWGFREDRNVLQRLAIFAVSWVSAFFHHHTIVINSSDHADANQFISRKKISLIPLGISSSPSLSRKNARAFFNNDDNPITDDTLLIGVTAELTKNKGLSYFVDAIAQVRTALPKKNIHCIIMGEGEQHPHLAERIKACRLNHHISLVGFIPNAHRYLPAFDLFALTSVKEGLPYAIMEAMAAELPVVASRVGGIPDLITHGKNGMLAPVKQVPVFAAHITHLLKSSDERRMLGLNAKQTIITHYNLDRMITSTANLYDQLTQTHQ